jgi:hypothetical protein
MFSNVHIRGGHCTVYVLDLAWALFLIYLQYRGEGDPQSEYWGIFCIFCIFLCMYFIQHCFIYRLSDSTVSEDAGI